MAPPAVLQNVPFPEKLKTEGNLANNWKRFLRAWSSYEVASRVKEQDEKIRAATLQACMGEDAQEIMDGLQFENETDRQDADKIIDVMKNYCLGETNETYERYIFFSRNQESEEKIDSYVAVLRNLVKTCSFQNLEEGLLRDRIVMGIRDNGTRKKLLTISKLELKKCIEICRANETTDRQLSSIACTAEAENKIHKLSLKKSGYKGNKSSTSRNQGAQPKSDAFSCLFCGGHHAMRRELCPAYGKICSKCKGKNHFAIKCNASKRRIYAVSEGWEPNYESEEEDEEEEFEDIDCVQEKIEINAVKTNRVCAQMLLSGKSVSFQLDTGASTNLINEQHVNTNSVVPTAKTLVMWNKAELKPLGETRLMMVNPKNNKRYRVNFVVVKQNLMPLLGANAVEQMGLISINRDHFCEVAKVETSIIDDYAEVFDGKLGNLPGKAHFVVDDSVVPVVSPNHNVPVSLKSDLKNCLKSMVDNDVIEPVDKPTEWVNNIVITKKKDGSLRVCLDPRPLNKALKRERYQLPVLDDVLPSLSQAKIFTTFDLQSGYWHVKLDEESSDLTTFSTPFGRFKWKRLPFGASVSSEMFQKRLYQAIGDLEGVLCIADDILLYGVGSSTEDAFNDHEMKMKKLLERCRDVGIKLNKSKMKLRQESVVFMGHVLTTEGLKPDEEKIKAVVEMPKPTDVEGVRRLNGFVNYLAKFLPKLSDVTEPIRQLTRKDVPFIWSSRQETAFREIKELVTAAPLLQYYDVNKELTIQCDASQSGLGATMMQEGKPIAFASRALTDTETRYAQIEKELLAIVYSLEKFYQYTYGRFVTVRSDHKPLEAIMKKPLMRASKRLQGMMLRLQKFDIEVRYQKGKEMYIADTLSRAFLPSATPGPQDDLEQVHMSSFLPITERRLNIIKVATEQDETMQRLKSVIVNGWPEEKGDVPLSVTPYFSFRDELTITDGIILKGNRVVIPSVLRKEMKDKIHSSHLGAESCIRRARESLYWPNMAADIKDVVTSCSICRSVESANQKETLMNHDVPERPWAKVGTDLFSLNQKDFLITVDYFSSVFEVDRLHSTTSASVIKKLKNHFSRYGSPEVLISDNGPQYSSDEFSRFAMNWDFEHRPSSPGNSQANGKAESAVKIAKNIIKKAIKSGQDVFMAILDYRNTPTQGMETSPTQRSLGRRTRTLLPTSEKLLRPSGMDCSATKSAIKRGQERQKKYFDSRCKDLVALQEGDLVRMKPLVKGKHEWAKGYVAKRLDQRSYEVETEHGTLRRNRVHLKRSNEKTSETETADKPKPDIPIASETFKQIREEFDKSTTKIPTDSDNNNPLTTRSGRVVKKPSKYSD